MKGDDSNPVWQNATSVKKNWLHHCTLLLSWAMRRGICGTWTKFVSLLSS